jgi:hypothetical protein
VKVRTNKITKHLKILQKKMLNIRILQSHSFRKFKKKKSQKNLLQHKISNGVGMRMRKRAKTVLMICRKPSPRGKMRVPSRNGVGVRNKLLKKAMSRRTMMRAS